MATPNQELTRMFRVRRTVLQMLRDRGYMVLDTEEDLGMVFERFREEYGSAGFQAESLTILRSKKDDTSEKIYVFFPQDKKVGVKPIREYCERMEREGIRQAIIVILSGMTPSAKEALQVVASEHSIETFMQNELLVNITEHILVPKHEVLTPTEKTALLKMYKLKESQLPESRKQIPLLVTTDWFLAKWFESLVQAKLLAATLLIDLLFRSELIPEGERILETA